MARLRRPPRLEPEQVDPDALVCPVHLLPDAALAVEERRQRSRDREAWFKAQGLGSRRGDYVRRRNAIIRGHELSGIPEPPKPPDPRELLRDLT